MNPGEQNLDCYRFTAMTSCNGLNQGIAVFGQRQDLPDPDLNRRRGRDILRPLAGFALDRIHGIEADVELDALRDQALDQFAVGIIRKQQIDARSERHHLDRDLVGIVELQQIIGDADHEALLFGIIVRKLQHDAMFGERLVRQRRRFGAGGLPERGQDDRCHHGAAEGADDRSPIYGQMSQCLIPVPRCPDYRRRLSA